MARMEVYGLGLSSTKCDFLKVGYWDSRIRALGFRV